MRVRIDFSLFASPQDAFGNVNGFIEIPSVPQVGDHMMLGGHEFRVERVEPFDFAHINHPNAKGIMVGLDDVVLASRSEAKEFADRVERETEGELMCDEYE